MLPDDESWEDEWDTDFAGDDDFLPEEEEAGVADEEFVAGYTKYRWKTE